MAFTQKKFTDAGVSKGYLSGLEINDGTPFVREPKSLVGTDGTYAISEKMVMSFTGGTAGGILNFRPDYANSGVSDT